MGVRSYSTTPASNTNVLGSVFTGTDMARADVDNAIRQLLADIAASNATRSIDVWEYLTDSQRTDVTAGTLLVDCSSAFQAALDAASGKTKTSLQTGCELHIRAGKYLINNTIKFDWRNTESIVDANDLRKLRVRGEGSAVTALYSTVTGTTFQIKGYGNADGTILDTHLEGFTLFQKQLGSSLTGTGLVVNQVRGAVLRDVRSMYFDTGFNASDTILLHAEDCDFGGNNGGVFAESVVFSSPNVIKLENCHFGGCQQAGAQFGKGSNVLVESCNFEGIGTSRTTHTCLRFTDGPNEGGCQASIVNCYFENTKVIADISFEWNSTDSGAVKIDACSFRRGDTDRYPVRHIRFAQASTGALTALIESCEFKYSSPYVPGSNAAWEAVSPTTYIKIEHQGCHFQSEAEFPIQPAVPVIASAATVTLPITGDTFQISGTTNITSITARSVDQGRTVKLLFQGALTFTDGSNLKLNGNFVTTADDVITLTCFDGTNWHEVARSAN